MNATQLLANFNRLSEAEDAYPRLRRFILDLAVRGKLVEQDARDEPADVLLMKIESEFSRLVKIGEIRKPKALPPIVASGEPFDPPKGWKWVRIRQVTSDHGQTVPAGEFTYIDVGSINKEAGVLGELRVLSEREAPSRARKVVRHGDVLYSCVRPTLLNIAVVDDEITPLPIASTAFAVLNSFGLVLPRYLWIALRSPYLETIVEAGMRGQAYPAINDAEFALLPLPLPPLAEQHRIVAKVDELMTLCDRLEAAQQEREHCRDRLVAASLRRLNQPAANTTPEAQHEHVRFYLNHLFRLTKRRDHINDLRQSIFSLAVRGLLVKQDWTEEPSTAVLKSIRLEKAQHVKAGTIPKEKTAPEEAVLPFPLPENWQAVRLGEVCNFVTSGSRGWAAYYAESGPKFLRAQNIRFGRLRLDDIACVNPPAKSEGARTQVQIGDLLIVITGAGVTNPALLESDLGEAYVSQHVALVRPTKTAMSKWLLLCLMSGPGGRDELVERAYGAGKPGLNLDNIRSLNTPIPPLAEQHRIVAKVEELIDLFDQIETLLSAVQTDSSALLDNLLNKTLGVVRAASKSETFPTVSAKPSELHKMGKESRFMTTSPANTVDQLMECIDDLGGATTPERLLMQTGLSDDVEAFYDLIRAARDSGKLTALLGAGEEIRRLVDAD